MKTLLINGSPKKKGSASAFILSMVRLCIKGDTATEQVRGPGDHGRVLEALRDADTVVFVLPLYVDAIPSHVLGFMKEMEKFCTANGLHPRIYAVSNSGFIEGNQNRPLMKIFENFCRRCESQWCGGLGIGGGVMLNTLKILFFVFSGIFAVNLVAAGFRPALEVFLSQLATILFFSSCILFHCLHLGMAISNGGSWGVKFTRILMPSFLFILAADVFFVIISLFQGGLFRGWLHRKI